MHQAYTCSQGPIQTQFQSAQKQWTEDIQVKNENSHAISARLPMTKFVRKVNREHSKIKELLSVH